MDEREAAYSSSFVIHRLSFRVHRFLSYDAALERKIN
jgi:hypothetical protein